MADSVKQWQSAFDDLLAGKETIAPKRIRRGKAKAKTTQMLDVNGGDTMQDVGGSDIMGDISGCRQTDKIDAMDAETLQANLGGGADCGTPELEPEKDEPA